MNLSKEWENLIRLAGQMKFGTVEIVIKNGVPVRADNIVQQVKLDEDSFSKDMKKNSIV